MFFFKKVAGSTQLATGLLLGRPMVANFLLFFVPSGN